MKKVILLGYLISLALISESQTTHTLGGLIFTDSLKLKPLNDWITINNPESNIWEVGKPNKSYFNSSHIGKQAIITDSVNTYPNKLDDYFYITIPSVHNMGEGILSFYHKYDTDTLTDGGIIEVSYDNQVTWENILNDDHNLFKNLIGVYSDTIKGGEFGFSGKSNGWQYVEIYWLWLMKTKQTSIYPIVRFRFVSDEINTNKDGWMIDDIVFRCYDVIGNVNKPINESIKAFPNPTNGLVKFSLPDNGSNNIQIEVYNYDGRLVLSKSILNNQIDISNLNKGFYTYKIFSQDRYLGKGKLIKN